MNVYIMKVFQMGKWVYRKKRRMQMDSKVIDQCKIWLEERKTHINENSNRNKDKALDEEVGELSTFDNHPGDMGTELFERERDETITKHEQSELEDINHALAKIEKNTYHLCDECGKTIQEERLLIMPTARYCIDHAQ